jgi:hypothetical protein
MEGIIMELFYLIIKGREKVHEISHILKNLVKRSAYFPYLLIDKYIEEDDYRNSNVNELFNNNVIIFYGNHKIKYRIIKKMLLDRNIEFSIIKYPKGS